MRCATYLRVSTKGQDLEPQRTRLAAFAAERGWAIVAEHSDIASGRRDRRPGLDAALAAIRRGEADALLVVRLDRAARSVRHLAQLAEQVPIVASDQGFDTTTASGRMVYGMLSVVAAFESDLISERTRDGQAVARAKGTHMGRPGTVGPDAVLVARMLRAAGASWREAAGRIGCSASALRRAAA
jgi:DNA invertase Pin-like site-specific DNA recombinase